jgi:hypothetical protein
MTEKENVITSKDVNKKTTKQKKIVKEEKPAEPVVKNGKLLIYFESGIAYQTSSGIRFSKEQNRMAEIDAEEADFLLKLPNFRLPSDEEKEFYYNNLEA